ncbi:hypothetical protein ASPBRDRAFT_39381 [Aspergillus brasiliensis CBS 101740]|uniref:Uncharacterized protein n=1 Tax=Aspergillus brasiliensis (strain CBS 101740 / IMI 381727 / IBT 21946) TaxID=767769 RepID=A0A1L9UR77_ASPBC|nr:hypothetical protein ASPBRDRAFT_39381 [Aspergillus brasiliensis CBS 101740]
MTVVGRHSLFLSRFLYIQPFCSPGCHSLLLLLPLLLLQLQLVTYSTIPLPSLAQNKLPAYSVDFDLILPAKSPSSPTQLLFEVSYIRLTPCPDLLSGAWLRAHVPCSSSTSVFGGAFILLFSVVWSISLSGFVWLHQRPQDDSSPSVRSNDNRATASR